MVARPKRAMLPGRTGRSARDDGAASRSEPPPWPQRRTRDDAAGARPGVRPGPRPTIRTLPVLERRIPVYEVLDQEGLEMVHEASLAILEQVGIEFRDAEAVGMWRTPAPRSSATGCGSRASC